MAAKGEFTLGQACIEMDFCTLEQVREALKAQDAARAQGQEAPRMGDLLVQKGYLTEGQLTKVLKATKKSARKFAIPGYKLTAKIGAGGYGAVFQAHQESMDRSVAIKVLKSEFSKDPEYVNRFEKEARTAAKLQHENIVAAYDTGEAMGRRFLVMEYVDGEPVSNMIRRHAGGLPEKEACKVMVQALHAIQYAHDNDIIHRDLKPDNILVTHEGKVKVCDLGLAKVGYTQNPNHTMAGVAAGSPGYISPEQARGADKIDPRADIYSLGATFYRMVTGKPPFRGSSPQEILAKHIREQPTPPKEHSPALSDTVNSIILRMMAKDPSHRFDRPDDIADMLEAHLAGGKKKVRRESPVHARQKVEISVHRTPVHDRFASKSNPVPFIAAVVIVALIGYFVVLPALQSSSGGPGTSNGSSSSSSSSSSSGNANASSSSSSSGSTQDQLRRIQEQKIRQFERSASSLPNSGSYPTRIKMLTEISTFLEGLNDKKLQDQAESVRKSIFESLETEAGQLWGRLESDYTSARRNEKLGEAIRLLEVFPEDLLEVTERGREIRDNLNRLWVDVKAKFQSDKAALDGHIKSGKFGDAVALLDEMEYYATDSMLAEINASRKELENTETAVQGTLLEAVQAAYDGAYSTFRDQMIARNPEAALGTMAAFLRQEHPDEWMEVIRVRNVDYEELSGLLDSDPSDATHELIAAWVNDTLASIELAEENRVAQFILFDLRDAATGVVFLRAASEGVDTWVEEKARLELSTFPDGEGIFRRDGDALEFLYVKGGEGKTPVYLGGSGEGQQVNGVDLVRAYLRTLHEEVGEAQAQVSNDRVQAFRVGIGGFYFGDAGSASLWLTTAKNLGTPGAERYIDAVSDLVAQRKEIEATAVFEKAKDAFTNARWDETEILVDRLLNEFGETELVEKNRSFIEEQAGKIEALKAKEAEFASTFGGDVSMLPDGRVRVAYTFEDENDLSHWDLNEVGGSWKLSRGRLLGNDSPRMTWKHDVTGDLRIEVEVIPRDVKNILFMMYDHDGRGYQAGIGWEFVGRGVEEKAGFPSVGILKYPLKVDMAEIAEKYKDAAFWDALKGSLIGIAKDEVDIPRNKPLQVRFERRAGSISLRLNGQEAWMAADMDYNTGKIRIHLADGNADFERVVITFKPE